MNRITVCAVSFLLAISILAQKPIQDNVNVELLQISRLKKQKDGKPATANRMDFFTQWNNDGFLGKIFENRDSIAGILNYIDSLPVEKELPFDVYDTYQYIKIVNDSSITYYEKPWPAAYILLTQHDIDNMELIWINYDPPTVFRRNYQKRASKKFVDWIVNHQDSIK